MSCYHPSVCYVFYDKKTLTRGHTLVYKDFDYQKFGEIDYAVGTEKSFYNKKFQCIDNCVCTASYLIPCGHCVGCSNAISKEWSQRLMFEKAVSKNAYFLTITYDDDHIPKNHQLVKQHLESFIKDIRNYYYNHYGLDKIRYYAVGEYGSKSGRCHYHAIIFNLPLTDLDFKAFGIDGKSLGFHPVGKSTTGEILYQFDLLNDLWSRGFVVVGEVSLASASYVARYVDKKRLAGVKNKLLISNGIVPEFSICSRMPGIGSLYFEKYYEKILDENLVVWIEGKSLSVGRYFEKFLKKNHPEELGRYKLIKEKKSVFGKSYINGLNLRSNDTSINDELVNDEVLKIASYNTLKRNL